MKFRTTKEKIFSALSETNKIIPIRTTLPILSCVLVEVKKEKVVLTATDLEQTIITKIEADTITQGSIAVPGNRFIEIISALQSGALEISSNENMPKQYTKVRLTKNIRSKFLYIFFIIGCRLKNIFSKNYIV